MMVFIDGIKSHIGLCGGAMLAALPGGRRERQGVKAKGKGGGVVLAVYWHTERPQYLSKGNMQTPAFREINTVPQTAQSASGE